MHHEQSFNEWKSCIPKPPAPVLSYHGVKLHVTVSADSSQNGLGSVCIQNNKPIAYSSRALSDTERNYGQIEKEILALLYLCQRFNSYIFGRAFTAEIDHKPFVTILKKQYTLQHLKYRRCF